MAVYELLIKYFTLSFDSLTKIYLQRAIFWRFEHNCSWFFIN